MSVVTDTKQTEIAEAPIFDEVGAKERLRDVVTRGGALVMGIADAEAFGAAQPGHRPTDFLPKAKSVVVFGGAQPRAGDWQSPNYQTMEVSSTTDRITGLGNKVAQSIEREFGYYALNVPPGVDQARLPFIEIALAAELAGCGTRSLAGPVLHPEFGFMYFGAVLTTMPMPVDGVMVEPVCPAPDCVEMWREHQTTPCMATCPIDDGGCLGGSLDDDDKIKERRFDAPRCTARAETHWIPGFQKTLSVMFDEDDPERRRMILNSSLFSRTLWSITYANVSQGQCFECMRVCPVGQKHRILK